jgi:hypothetical protein
MFTIAKTTTPAPNNCNCTAIKPNYKWENYKRSNYFAMNFSAPSSGKTFLSNTMYSYIPKITAHSAPIHVSSSEMKQLKPTVLRCFCMIGHFFQLF